MEKGILTSAERDFYLQRPTRQTETSAEARSMLPAPAGMLEVTKPGKWPKISLRIPEWCSCPLLSAAFGPEGYPLDSPCLNP